MASSPVTDRRKQINSDDQTATETAIGQPSRFSQLRWAGPLAIGTTGVINGLLFLITDTVGVFPSAVVDPGSGQPFTVVTVVLASVVGALGATLVYAGFDRFVPDADRRFRIVAGAVLLASFATPFTILGAPLGMIATLLVMHVVVAGVSVWVFTADREH
jgi:hypothetical protein